MEWPGIHITQTLLNILGTKGICFNFIDDKGTWEDHLIHFYERNPAGRGLDFDDSPEDKLDLTMYAVEFRYLNPTTNTNKLPLPTLEEMSEAVSILLTT